MVVGEVVAQTLRLWGTEWKVVNSNRITAKLVRSSTINSQLLSGDLFKIKCKSILFRVVLDPEPIPGSVGARQGHPKWDAGLFQATMHT